MKIVFRSLFASLLLALLPLSASAQEKGASGLLQPGLKKSQPVAVSETPAPASGVSSSTFRPLSSHIKSLGTIGRYEIVSVKIRGLDTPNVAGFLVYDRATDTLVGMDTQGAPGLGVALVNGAASVGSNFLFGYHLKPNNENTTVSGGNSQSGASANSTGGSSSASSGSTSSAAGGNANATGGNGNGGAGGSGGNGGAGGHGGSFTPPGHQPGHGNPHYP